MTTVNFSVNNSDGSPISGASVDIVLPEAGVDALGENLTLPTSVQGNTDINGNFSTELSAISNVPYSAVVYDANKNRKAVYEFFVPESVDPVDVAALALLPAPSGITYDAAAIAAISNLRILAEQAADRAENFRTPRYNVNTLAFTLVGGINTVLLSEDDINGFLQVEQSVGRIVIPSSSSNNFEIGSSFVFVNTTSPQQIIDIDFTPENSSVAIESIGLNATKLDDPSDFILLTKVAVDTWKIINLKGGSGTGGATDADLIDIINSIADLLNQVSALEGWRNAFDGQLVSLTTDVNNQSSAIASLNNSIATINNLITAISTNIDDKIAAAVPLLPDLTSYVNAAANSAANAALSQTGAATSAGESEDSKGYSEEWANKDEDVLVSVAAGGNGVDEYSSKHWAIKSEESANTLNVGFAGNAGKLIQVNATEDGFSYIPFGVLTYDFASIPRGIVDWEERWEYDQEFIDLIPGSVHAHKIATIKFSKDGTRLYILVTDPDDDDGIYQFDLGTAYSLSSITYSGNSINFGDFGFLDATSFNDDRASMDISTDGTQLIVQNREEVIHCELSVAWELNSYSIIELLTISDVNRSNDISCAKWADSGDSLIFIVRAGGSNDRKIYKRSLPSSYTLTGSTLDVDLITAPDGDPTDMFVTSDDSLVFVFGKNSSVFSKFQIVTPGDFDTAVLISSINLYTYLGIFESSNKDVKKLAFTFSDSGSHVFFSDEGTGYLHKFKCNSISIG